MRRKTAAVANSRVATPKTLRRWAQELLLCAPQSTLQRQGFVMGLLVMVLGTQVPGFNGSADG